MGCIRPSAHPFASPVLLVKKPDGGLRFCIDYHELNKITVRDTFLLPRTNDLINTLANSKVFSGLDLQSGYWQMHVAEDSVE